MTNRAADGTVDPRRRVLWLAKGLGPGGAERLLVATARLADHDRFAFEVAFVVPWKDHLVPELEAAGVTVHRLGTGRRGGVRWMARLARLVRSGGYDVVHAHSPLPAVVARLARRRTARASRPQLVSTEHNLWPRFALATRAVNRATFRLDDRHLAVSHAVLDALPPSLRASTAVLVQGVDVDAVRSALREREGVRRELGIGAGEIVVGTVANLRASKAYPDLLRAARLVLDAPPALPVRFVAVGQGPLEAEVRALHAELDLGDRFRLLGYRDDPWRVLAGCDVFCLSSVHEGLPIALLEAMVLGLPVVATAVGGIPEAVTDGVEGVLVPPHRPDALAAALLDVAGDPVRRAALAAAAARRSEGFGLAPAVEAVQALYDELLDGRAVRGRG